MDPSLGCEQCCPESAEAAWEARSRLGRIAELIGESHYHVMVLNCRACESHFVSVFTETVDWSDGDDPQYWKLLPITHEESAALVQQGESVTEGALGALGPGRRCLCLDHPKGSPEHVYWSHGLTVGWHD